MDYQPYLYSKRALLIINPVAGRKAVNTQIAPIIRIFMEAGYLVTTMITARRGEASIFARQYAKGYDLLVCAGGDGTLHEVINGLANAEIRIPLGYIPCGTTNDFAASHGISADILKAARQAAYGKESVYDIGCFENQYFSYVALFSAFSWMAYTTDQDLKNRIGYTAYLLDAAKDLNRNLPHHLRVTANGVTYEDDYIFGAVSNAKKLAGIIELPEGLVDTNDGRLEVFLVKAPKSLLDWDTILRGVVARDFSSPFFELTQAEEIWIDNELGLTWSLDGECSGEMERIHIVPKHSFMYLKT